MTIPLMAHQRASVDFSIKNNYNILALQQGLGKSFAALATAMETNSNALIVVPAYLRLKWKMEIEKFFPGEVVSLFENDKSFYQLWDTRFCIISYNSVAKADILFEWADMVIWDEAHFLKTPNAIRTDMAHKLIYENSIKRCLLLTGTPLQNRVYEFWSLLALCHYDPRYPTTPKFLNKFSNYVDFANHFSYLKEFEIYTARGKKKIQRWEGYRKENHIELQEYLKDHYIRFTTEEVLDLPAYTEIEVPMSYQDRPELMDVFHKFSLDAEEEERDWSIKSNIKRDSALAKAEFTAVYVQNLLDQCEQVVVYSDHVSSCLRIAELLKVPAITGQMNMVLRQKLADDFMAGSIQVIVATIGSFSTGIDLYSAANMVFNDLPFVPGTLDQAKYRIRRIGQTRHCFYHFIMGSMQDFKIKEILDEKIKTISAII